MKRTLRNTGKILTSVLPPQRSVIEHGYDYHQRDMVEAVDFWFILATDLSYKWNSVKPLAPIQTRDGDGIVIILFLHHNVRTALIAAIQNCLLCRTRW